MVIKTTFVYHTNLAAEADC